MQSDRTGGIQSNGHGSSFGDFRISHGHHWPQFSAFLFRRASGGCAQHSSESGSSCIAALRYMAAGIVRASIMVICALLCRALNRRPDSLNGLAAAAVLILAFEPFQLYSVGFQLSFAACFGLILFSKQFETALASAHIPLAGSVSACLGAALPLLRFKLHISAACRCTSLRATLLPCRCFRL